MTNYYKTQMFAFNKIDDRITQAVYKGSGLNIDLLVLEITSIYPISPKAVEKRVQLFVSAHKNELEINGREVRLL